MKPLFGPGGNSKSFYDAGFKHTYQAPGWVSGMGLDAYEYQGGNGIYGSMETFAKIGSEAVKHNIKMSLHAPYYIALSSVDPEKRLNNIGYIQKSVDAALAMNADIIVIHAGSTAKISRDVAMDYAKDSLYKSLESAGDVKMRYGIETMGKLNQLGTLEEVIEICKLDSRLCPVIDFGHLNARNVGGYFNTADDYRKVFELIGSTSPHCHFSKIEYTKAGEKKHLTFEDTVFGPEFEPLAEAIVKDGLSPRIICESADTMAEDALKMKALCSSAA